MMPAPGSLKRRPFDAHDVARLLHGQFHLPENETLAYLKLVETRELGPEDIAAHMGITTNEASELGRSMVSKGLIIEAPGPALRYVPLHPRMMLTNLFKVYEKDAVAALRERRATVDRVVNLLTPVYEEKEVRRD